MKKLFSVLIFGIISLPVFLNSQELPKVVPPSPEAAQAFKFTEIPVSLYTGLPNIDIPLFQIESGGVTIPISLSYHARGIQVSEIASRVGTGWTLNAGGMITRQVREIHDDFYTNCSYNDFYTNVINRWHIAHVHETSLECDMMPDQFSFSVNGMSGKFFNVAAVKVQEYGNLKVTKSSIVDGKGNKYFFQKEDKERTMSKKIIKGNNTYITTNPSAYEATLLPNTSHLTKIETILGGSIDFYYSEETTMYIRRSSDKKFVSTIEYESYISEVESVQQRLDSIKFDQGKLVFIYDSQDREDLPGSRALKKIILKDYLGNIIKQAVFNYHYTQSSDTSNLNYYLANIPSANNMITSAYKRLFLSSVQILDKDNNSLPPYTFEYNPIVLPNRHSTSVDAWGYYNGKNNGRFLESSDDRRVDRQKVQAGMLTSITKPEGGKIQFYYEPNRGVNIFPETVKFDNPNPIDNKEVRLSIFDATAQPSSPNYLGNGEFEAQFYVSPYITGTASYDFSGFGVGNCLCSGPGCQTQNSNQLCVYQVTLKKLNSSNNFEPYVGIARNVLNRSINLTPGTYKINVKYNQPNSFVPSIDNYFLFLMKWQEEDMGINAFTYTEDNCERYIHENYTGNKIIYGAGNRIKKIEYYDHDDTIELTKTYSYEEAPGISSGRIVGLADFAQVSYIDMNGQTATAYEQEESIAGMFRTYQNNSIGYTRVTEFYGDAVNNIGKTEYQYTMVYDTGRYYEFPQHPPTDNEWLRGKELSVKHYKKVGNNYEIVKKIENIYAFPDGSEYSSANGFCYNSLLVHSDILPMSQDANPNQIYATNEKYFKYPLAVIPIPRDSDNIPKYKIYYMTGGVFDLKKTTITEYFDTNQELVSQTEYLYAHTMTHHNLKSTKHSTSNPNVLLETIYQYPQELANTLIIYQKMVDKNIVDIPVNTNVYRGTTKLSEEHTSFREWEFSSTHKLLLPELIKTSKGTNSLENRIEYLQYDDKGNPLEVKQTNGTHIVYIWGYNQSYPIAKIENATYSQVSSYVSNLQTLSNGTNESGLISALDTLRANLPNALVTTYIYKPLVGVTSITDPRGYRTTYHYDSFGRLEYVKDQSGNILQHTTYNYQN